MKTTDSVKEKFIKWLAEESGEPEHLVMLMQSVYVNPESMFKFYSHSIAEARREEQERILTMAHNIRSELKEPGYISLTRLEVLLTGDNPEGKTYDYHKCV